MELVSDFAISFEFFPPQTSEGKKNLSYATAALSSQSPSFFSVTFGAGGSTRSGSLEIVRKLKQESPVPVAPHLSCIGSSRSEIIELLQEYKALGLKRIVALRGDMPSGMGEVGQYRYASELIALIREVTGDYFRIDAAAYPEIHPQALSPMNDILNLKRKYEAGANSAITQYFYNPDAYFYYVDDCARQGISMPIVPGIMPITQFSRLARFSDMCGAEIPRWIRKRLEAYGDDAVAIQAFGTEVVYRLCQQLMEGGAPGFHFYTLNRADAVIRLLGLLGLEKRRATAQNASAETLAKVVV